MIQLTKTHHAQEALGLTGWSGSCKKQVEFSYACNVYMCKYISIYLYIYLYIYIYDYIYIYYYIWLYIYIIIFIYIWYYEVIYLCVDVGMRCKSRCFQYVYCRYFSFSLQSPNTNVWQQDCSCHSNGDRRSNHDMAPNINSWGSNCTAGRHNMLAPIFTGHFP